MGDDALAVRLRAIFTDELDEQVQQLNEDLLALERAPGDEELLRAVFRVMHTLKGASRAAGFPLVEALCHALENELSRVRDGGLCWGARRSRFCSRLRTHLAKRETGYAPDSLFRTSR